MFEKWMKDVQNLNSKANWENLAAGIILLLVLAGGSLWFFANRSKNQPTPDEQVVNFDSLTTDKQTDPKDANISGGATDNTVDSRPLGTGGPITQLPNTSSK